MGAARRHEARAGVRLRRGTRHADAGLYEGRDSPMARLESRLKCPRCGSRRVRLAFSVPPEFKVPSAKWLEFGVA